VTTLTEQAAELFIADLAFGPAPPGFVGAAVDLPFAGPAERLPLRHGFLAPAGPRLASVSGPPSPGLAVCLGRMSDDLEAARPRLTTGPAGSTRIGPEATGPTGDDSPAGGIRVGLEAGLDGGGVLGINRRWALANTLAPVLAAAFASTPVAVRRAAWRDRPVVPPGANARASWTAYAMNAHSFRERFRSGERPTLDDLIRHLNSLRPPVAARGHLEWTVADPQPGDGWRLPVTLAATLLDDPQAAQEAEAATAHLHGEPALWERAARHALADPVLAAAARDCFLAAYAALARQGADRDLRDAVAAFTERYVLHGRCPADDAGQMSLGTPLRQAHKKIETL